MTARLSWPSGAIAIWLLISPAHADDGQFGDLDFSRMTKAQEQFFWKRLKSLAFEEAVLTYCGQPDDFETRAKQGIRSCVTAEALDKAESFYRTELKSSLARIGERKLQCSARTDSTKGWLGVNLEPVGTDVHASHDEKGASGALVAGTFDDSPAAAADVEAGDVIVSVNGETIADPKALSAKIGALAPGASVQLGVVRKGAPRSVSVKLGAMAFDRQGKIAFDMPALVASSKEDLKYASDEVTKMCQQCKSSIWAVFCH